MQRITYIELRGSIVTNYCLEQVNEVEQERTKIDTMLDSMKTVNSFLWSGPMLILLFGTHLYFTFRLKFVQKKIGKAIRLSFSSEADHNGNVSSFSTLTTTLAATLGTGNIIGMSTAIALGGPGAVFWCWLTGVFGMATTYAECYLSMVFRKKNALGNYTGGPMYAIEYGLKSRSLAIIFSICTLLVAYGMGCSTQARAITDSVKMIGISPYLSGILSAFVIGLAIAGGVKKIQSVCMKLVPIMAGSYLFFCIIILILNRAFFLEALQVIFRAAFVPQSIAGGAIGGTLQLAARYGISRGLFTNEAGLGSAAIPASDAKNNNPHIQALVSMSSTFWDTVVMCAVTGIVIISTILRNPSSIQGLKFGELTNAAFSTIPHIGIPLLNLSLVAFAAATLIGWSYLGERAVVYLFGQRGISIYRLTYIIMIFFGSILSLDIIWESADLLNAIMVIPNLIALYTLRKHIKAE